MYSFLPSKKIGVSAATCTRAEYIDRKNSKQIQQKKQAKNVVKKLILAEELISPLFLDITTTKKSLLETIKKIKTCGDTAAYKTSDYLITPVDGTPPRTETKTKLFNTNFCNVPTVCPICAERHARRKYARMQPAILELIKKYKYIYMTTFTTPDNFNFNDNYNLLNASLRRFFLMGQKRGTGRSAGEAAKIRAAIICKEIKKGKNSKNYHIHAHSIIFCDSKIDYSIYKTAEKNQYIAEYKTIYGRAPDKEKLRQFYKQTVLFNGKEAPISKFSGEWFNATNGTALNVDIRPIFTPQIIDKLKTGREKKNALDTLNKSIREIIKYPAKINDFLPDEILDILINRKGKRLFSTTGELLKFNDSKTDEIEEEIFTEDIYAYNYNKKNEQLEPVSQGEKNRLFDRIINPQPYDEYKKIILEKYRESERIKKFIYRLYVDEKETKWIYQFDVSEIHLQAIQLIDRVTTEYNAMKKAYYRLLIEGEKVAIREYTIPPADIFSRTHKPG